MASILVGNSGISPVIFAFKDGFKTWAKNVPVGYRSLFPEIECLAALSTEWRGRIGMCFTNDSYEI